MSRRYEEAFGVVPIRWTQGDPDAITGLPYLVEVWRAETRLLYSEDRKPRVAVTATIEIRVWLNGTWKRLAYNGELVDVKPGEVRRHAKLGSNTWFATISLDGWNV